MWTSPLTMDNHQKVDQKNQAHMKIIICLQKIKEKKIITWKCKQNSKTNQKVMWKEEMWDEHIEPWKIAQQNVKNRWKEQEIMWKMATSGAQKKKKE